MSSEPQEGLDLLNLALHHFDECERGSTCRDSFFGSILRCGTAVSYASGSAFSTFPSVRDLHYLASLPPVLVPYFTVEEIRGCRLIRRVVTSLGGLRLVTDSCSSPH